LTVVIVVVAIFSYIYVVNSSPGQLQSTPTPTPTTSPTSSPTAHPTSSPTAAHTPNPTASPTSTPTATPTATATPTPTPTPSPVTLNGAGATFPQPFLNTVINAFSTQKPWLSINYQGVGSGTGINSLTSKTVDFAASDAPLSTSQVAALSSPAVHIPETIGAVTLAYNLPSAPSGLHLSGQVIANIYQGTITNWNDPAIATLNPSVTLPNNPIQTVRRADSSGTTNVFTHYLSAVSSTWNTQVGAGTSVQWPGTNTIGQSGNAAVASYVNTTQYTIGYVELSYALQNGMTVASVQNPSGNYIAPTLASTTAAVQSGASQGLPSGDQSWTTVSLLNTNDPQAYPIVSFTYLLEYKELNVIPGMTQDKATAIVQFFWYIVHDGQSLAPAQSYAQLPPNVVQIDETTIRSITFNGQIVYPS
jgi:phosphate transport system substrate-binding protein